MRYRIILDPSSFRFHFRLKDQSEASENPSENYSYASNGTFIQEVSHNLDPLGVVEKTFPLAPSFAPLPTLPRVNIRFRLRRDTNCANANPCRTFENSGLAANYTGLKLQKGMEESLNRRRKG